MVAEELHTGAFARLEKRSQLAYSWDAFVKEISDMSLETHDVGKTSAAHAGRILEGEKMWKKKWGNFACHRHAMSQLGHDRENPRIVRQKWFATQWDTRPKSALLPWVDPDRVKCYPDEPVRSSALTGPELSALLADIRDDSELSSYGVGGPASQDEHTKQVLATALRQIKRDIHAKAAQDRITLDEARARLTR